MLSNMQQKTHLKKEYFNLNFTNEIKSELKNFENKESQYTIPVFIPHFGCKNECIFCNQRKISGNTKKVRPDDVDEIIKKRLEEIGDTRRSIQIAFFGGSFTGISINDQIAYLKVAKKYIDAGIVKSIRLSTRPDYISTKILKILKSYGVETIELGVQSMSNEVLEYSKRGHTKQDVIRATRLIHLFGIRLGIQIMIGLPRSTILKEEETIKAVLKLKPEDMRIYPVYVIHPSKLYDLYIDGKYIPLTLDETIKRVGIILRYCQKTNVRIIRLGLQSTDEITVSNKEIAGPVCDNMAEYVISDLLRQDLDNRISKGVESGVISEGKLNIVVLTIENRYASIVVGPKKTNKIYIENKYSKYNLKLKIKGEKDIEESYICI